MKTTLYHFTDKTWFCHPKTKSIDEKKATLVLCFGSKSMILNPDVYDTLKVKFPNSQITLCSTAGEIYQDVVLNNSNCHSVRKI